GEGVSKSPTRAQTGPPTYGTVCLDFGRQALTTIELAGRFTTIAPCEPSGESRIGAWGVRTGRGPQDCRRGVFRAIGLSARPGNVGPVIVPAATPTVEARWREAGRWISTASTGASPSAIGSSRRPAPWAPLE